MALGVAVFSSVAVRDRRGERRRRGAAGSASSFQAASGSARVLPAMAAYASLRPDPQGGAPQLYGVPAGGGARARRSRWSDLLGLWLRAGPASARHAHHHHQVTLQYRGGRRRSVVGFAHDPRDGAGGLAEVVVAERYLRDLVRRPAGLVGELLEPASSSSGSARPLPDRPPERAGGLSNGDEARPRKATLTTRSRCRPEHDGRLLDAVVGGLYWARLRRQRADPEQGHLSRGGRAAHRPGRRNRGRADHVQRGGDRGYPDGAGDPGARLAVSSRVPWVLVQTKARRSS